MSENDSRSKGLKQLSKYHSIYKLIQIVQKEEMNDMVENKTGMNVHRCRFNCRACWKRLSGLAHKRRDLMVSFL